MVGSGLESGQQYCVRAVVRYGTRLQLFEWSPFGGGCLAFFVGHRWLSVVTLR